jgi:hypothetical protein
LVFLSRNLYRLPRALVPKIMVGIFKLCF